MKKRPAVDTLGIDYGGVICERHTDANGVYQPIGGAFEALVELREKRFSGNIVIISHASRPLQHNIFRWLVRNDFFRKTGIPSTQLHFCTARAMKAELCRRYHVTHFVDDRTEIMEYLLEVSLQELYLFQPRADEIAGREHILAKVRQVDSWMALKAHLLG